MTPLGRGSAGKKIRIEVTNAVAQLVGSDRGKQPAIDILAMLENGGISLDPDNQAAVVAILKGAWTGLPGTVLDEMRAAVADN